MIHIHSIIYILIIIGICPSSTLQAQCSSWEGHPEGVEKAKEQHVLYRDLFRAKQYKKALPIWEQLYKVVQSPKEAPNRHFKDGIHICYNLAKTESNSKQKTVLVNTLLQLYRAQEDCIGLKASNKVWLGYHLYALNTEYFLAMEAFEKALDLDKNKTSSTVIVPMAQLSVYLYQKKHPKFTKAYLSDLYNQLKALAERNNTNIYLEKWKKAEQEFLRLQGQLTSIWDCSFFENSWKPLYLKDSNNITQNAKILNILKQKCGEESAFYQQVNAYQEYLKYYSCGPVKMNFYQKGKYHEMLSRRFIKNGDTLQYDKNRATAFEFYEEALKTEDSTLNSKEKSELAYRIAYQAYQEKDFPKARKWCRTASKYQPNWGEPYLLVGTLYASSYNQCRNSSTASWDEKGIVWVALDEWRKAKKVDPSIRDTANKRIKKYQKYLPRYEDIFQNSLEIGTPYLVECWIQQKTTIQVVEE